MKLKLFFYTLFFTSINLFSQDLVWNGNKNTDFFDEGNWQDKATGISINTSNNILRWNQDINRNLEISNVSLVDSWNDEGIIKMGSGILTVTNATIKINSLTSGTIKLEEDAYIEVLGNTNPLNSGLVINLNADFSWVKITNLKPEIIATNHLSKFKVKNAGVTYQTNLRLDNYYANGTIVRSNLATITPVTFYDRPNLTGTSVSLTADAVHSGTSITNLNNKIESFVLKKGYMLTIADDEVGTGKSKNYIASETDLTINKLPTHLLNKISFVRVVPWNWVTKKGIGVSGNVSLNEVGGTETTLGNTWFYRWSNTHDSNLNGEYTPMSWGVNGADEDSDITLYKQKYKATHILSFNESDHCTGQSGQYRNLCQEDVAIGYHRNLMKTGLRIVSPAGRENAPFDWLRNFYDKATAQDIRIDVIGVHWYDWGSNPESNPNHSATAIFNRFKTYLQDVYNEYGLPIWITEFNANRYRNSATQLAFMQLALPYLESLDYVERYAWFEPVHPSGNANQEGFADYYDDTNFALTNVGSFFINHNSSPSIPEQTIVENSNLGKKFGNNLALNHNILTNGDFKAGDLRAWLGYNNQVLSDSDNTTTNLDIFKNEPVGNINSGDGSLFQNLEVTPGVTYTVTFDYKWVGDGNHNLTAQIRRDLTGNTVIESKVLQTNFDVWYTESIDFTAPTNVFKARVFFYKAAGNRPLRITNLKVRVKPDKTWNGKVNNNWNTTGNWKENTVPSATDVVLIPRNLENYPTVSSNITVEQLFIDAGASFITTGTITGGVTYFADLPDDKWHLLSPPVSGQILNTNWVAAAGIATGQGSNIAIGSFQNGTPDGTTGPWEYFTGTASNFTSGKGYAMKKLSEGMFIFNGQLPAGTQNINITQGSGSNWNLIGNPFPSYIDVNQFLSINTNPLANAFQAIYVWNSDANSYKAITTGYIAPGQAFFVNSSSSSTTVNVTEAMLSHQKNVVFYKNSAKPKEVIQINISDNKVTKTTEIEFLQNKTKGLDPRFDIGLFDGVNSDLSIYTHLLENNEGIKFQKQTLPNTDFETTVIPLGVQAEAGKEITISTKTQNLPEGLNIFIEDRVLNTFTKLNEANANYKVTLNEPLDDVGRFYIHTSSKNVLNTNDIVLQNVTIYKVNAKTLRISGLSVGELTKLKMYNVLGKEVLSVYFKAERTKDIQLSKFSKGIYFVQLKNNQGTLNKKIIVE
jgi:hypothetical protein